MSAYQYSDVHPSLKLLEENWQVIRAEYLAAANKVTLWPEEFLHNGLWDVLGIHYPERTMPGASLCPRTKELVQRIPGLLLAGFSILRPGCVVLPHMGAVHGVWRSHLGLICPQDAWLEVLGERYVAREGKVVVFDDSNLHSAGNQGESDRVVLIVDFWKQDAAI
ncbi:aspartyl/asparaginyl beta-hydroxylase domain-containing protein [Herbaspirillum sp.]|uniref:aspartyl/asparaginyl beta-hydroxylase domain-containing protein n=1 Tax=Herbaspirillum sp. TaxID=1890675 RepID=UPI0031D1FBCE